MSGINASEIRELIDRHFSLQWCRENIVTPLEIMKTRDADGECMLVAIGNFSYLATIGEFIKERLANAAERKRKHEEQFAKRAAQREQRKIDWSGSKKQEKRRRKERKLRHMQMMSPTKLT